MASGWKAGDSIDKYTITTVNATKNFAISYRARDAHGNDIFLKQFIDPSPASSSWYRGFVDHQEKVKRVLDGFDRDEVAAPIRFFEHRDSLFAVYDFLMGVNLQEYLANDLGEEPSSKEIEFLDTTGRVFVYQLSRLHQAGLVHGDLKTDNLFLGSRTGSAFGKKIKLIDFDFSFFEGQEPPWAPYDEEEGKPGYIGTVGYRSPEHLQGLMPTQKSDVFTAAIILYYLYTGGHPLGETFGREFESQEEAAATFLSKYESGDFPTPYQLNAENPFVNKRMSDLIVQALSVDPDRRPVAQELHKVLIDGDTAAPDTVSSRLPLRLMIPGKTGYYPVDMDIKETFGQNDLRMFPAYEYVDENQFSIELQTDGQWILEGFPSHNNTRVNGEVVTGKRVALNDGDKISVGHFETTVSIV
jgi:serine/threonine protein kinase